MRGYTGMHAGTRQEPTVPHFAVNGLGEGWAARQEERGWPLPQLC